MKERQINSTQYPIQFLLVLSSDSKTGATGLLPLVNISKNGQPFGLASGILTETNFGCYSWDGNSFDRNTLGELMIHVSGIGADITDDKYFIVPWNPFEQNLGLNALSGINSQLPTTPIISGMIDNSWNLKQAELGSIPSVPASRSDMLEFMFERSHNLTKTTSSGDYIYKNDGITILGSGQLFDDGTTFTRGSYI